MPVNPGPALGQNGVDEDEDDVLIPPLGPAAPVPDLAIPVGDPGVADVPAASPDIAHAGLVLSAVPAGSASAPSTIAPAGPVGSEADAAPAAPVIPYSIGSVAGIELAPGGAFSFEVGAALAALQEECQNRGLNSPDSLLGALTAARLCARDSALLRVVS
ncbi:Collagen triple helix repeat [Gracilaria domingensis]|nr:Collagen triple helix repeat [Gracilaria domingensis]